MTELQNRCLDTFPQWLRTLGDDATNLASLLAAESMPEPSKRFIAGGLNYLFKSLDLIPDGIEDLGYLDDAFVLRVCADLALQASSGAREADPRGILANLGSGAALISELLGDVHARLVSYSRNLATGAARGRSVDDIVGDATVRSAFVSEVYGWAKGYGAPTFTRDEKNLVKLKSFLGSKLPA